MNTSRTFWIEAGTINEDGSGDYFCGDFAARPLGAFQPADWECGVGAGYDDFELFDPETEVTDDRATEIAFNDESLREQILIYLAQCHVENASNDYDPE